MAGLVPLLSGLDFGEGDFELVMGLRFVGRRFEEVDERAALEGRLGDEAGDGLEAEPGSGPDLREPQQQVGDQRGDDLDAHRILAGAEEVPDLQVLLDPLEEQLDLPAPLVERRDPLRPARRGRC